MTPNLRCPLDGNVCPNRPGLEALGRTFTELEQNAPDGLTVRPGRIACSALTNVFEAPSHGRKRMAQYETPAGALCDAQVIPPRITVASNVIPIQKLGSANFADMVRRNVFTQTVQIQGQDVDRPYYIITDAEYNRKYNLDN